jgi:hypothetical protein
MPESDAILPAARLRDLARGVQLLLPDRRDPHLFHERKSEIVADLKALARGLDGHKPLALRARPQDQLRLSVITAPPGLGRLPPLDGNCVFCRRRRSSQGRRTRLRLPGPDLFQWAEQAGRGRWVDAPGRTPDHHRG